PLHQLGSHGRKAIVVAVGPAIFNRHVAALDISRRAEALAKGGQGARIGLRRCAVEKPDHRHRLLRARRERPEQRRAAEQRDELAPPHPAHSRASGNPDTTVRGSGSPLSRGRTEFGSPPPHSITSSARSRKESGIVNPIALAAFRFIANSNFVGCSTGRAAGLVPCKILLTYAAARRNKSGWLAP